MDRIRYCPITATPFKKDQRYREYEPCKALLPYVRCFWGSEVPYFCHETENEIIIPDTCVDIIYQIDYTDQVVTGGFCGINDRYFYGKGVAAKGHRVATFAIRFYAWAAYGFAEDSMRGTVNGYFSVNERFHWLNKEMEKVLLELSSMEEMMLFGERLLLGKLDTIRRHEAMEMGVFHILASKGALDIASVARESFLSSRQLERIFQEYIGITPKKLSRMIRYQMLWQELVRKPTMLSQEAVVAYGFTDQSHLLHEFRRYHSMSMGEAKALAFGDVAKIQDRV